MADMKGPGRIDAAELDLQPLGPTKVARAVAAGTRRHVGDEPAEPAVGEGGAGTEAGGGGGGRCRWGGGGGGRAGRRLAAGRRPGGRPWGGSGPGYLQAGCSGRRLRVSCGWWPLPREKSHVEAPDNT